MSSVTPRDRRRLTTEIKDSIRTLRSELSALNRQIGGRLALKDGDLDCLDVIGRHGPLSPTALARRAGLHPATVTGVLDRLERAGWIARERDPADRRAVRVRALPERGREVIGLYAGMGAALDDIFAGYDDAQLAVLADFLGKAVAAGESATRSLADGTE
ncbi:MarR family transcriptional regulator [Catenuloplanes sp. NPDC051500]|uniref:MarR family transcriptional regulator n=1 Tax=Catenuloplanes sp. NPDC051500 TaxID=3363959 RepID=UPI0037B50828